MSVRPATAADVRAADAVRVAGWKQAYRGLVPQSFLDRLAVTDARVAWLTDRLEESAVQTLVAVEDEGVVGMAVHGPCRDEDLPGLHELYALYVLPSCWRRGTGTALLAGCGPVDVLWVLEGNLRGRTFYERHGFRADGTATTLDLDAPVVEVRYRLA